MCAKQTNEIYNSPIIIDMNRITILFTAVLMTLMVAPLSAQFLRLEVDEIDNEGKVPGKTFRVTIRWWPEVLSRQDREGE